MQQSRRQLSFDKAKTLENILHVFWQYGYLGASYNEICSKTKLTKPSLYAAFGNKEEMFLTALEFYSSQYIRPAVAAFLNENDLRKGLKNLLISTVDGLTCDGTPAGCLIASNIACTNAPDIPPAVTDSLHKAINETPNAIRKRFSTALPEELPSGGDKKKLTLFFQALISGLSGLARQGVSHSKLISIIDMAMLNWPLETSRK